MMILSTRLMKKKHDDDRLRVPSEPQELSDHISSGGQATSYDIFDRWSDTITSEETYSNPISRARLARMRRHDIFIYSRNL
jgi:hypothetical protein